MRQTKDSGPATNTMPGWNIDKGAYQLLLRRTAVNSEDDHFDELSLNAKWSQFGGVAGLTLTALPGWVGFNRSGALLSGLIQPVPSGEWYIETEVIWATENSLKWGGYGLILANSNNRASSIAAGFFSGGRAANGAGRMVVNKWTNGSYVSNYLEILSSPVAMDHQFFRIRKSGTTYYFYWSTTGVSWNIFFSITAADLGFTPTYFGLGAVDVTDQPAYFNYFLRY